MKRVCFAFLAALLLTGCMKDTPHEDATAKADMLYDADTTLDLCLYNTDTLNPLVTSVKQNAEVLSCLYDSLFLVKDDFSAEPNLCSAYHTSEDGLTFYAEIKKGVTFQNGKALTARDAAMSVHRLISSDGYYAKRLSCILSADAAEDTLKLTLCRKVPNLPRLLDFPILPEGGFVETSAVLLPPAPGSGVFLLTEYRVGDKLCLTANQNHHSGKLPYPEQAVIHVADSRKTAYTMLQNGIVDVLEKEDEPIPQGFHAIPYTGCRFVFLGVQNKAVADCVQKYLEPSAYLPAHAVPSLVPMHPKAADFSVPFRKDACEQERFFAGANPLPEHLTLLYCKTTAGRRTVAEGIAKNLTECGLFTEAEGVTEEVFFRRVASNEYDLFLGEVLLSPCFEEVPDVPHMVGVYFAAEELMHDGGFLQMEIHTLNPFCSVAEWR